MPTAEVAKRIKELKEKHNAIILAHNYQIEEVQDIADYVGDSFGLSQIAAETDADVIVFCGVHFMAESAKILSPDKKVILPVLDAGCPMADMVDVEGLRELKAKHPGVPVVTYVNSSAAVKAESDVCCTSSNAVEVVNSIDSDTVIFTPDKNLGSYVASKTNKNVIIWEGYCITHHRVEPDEVRKVKEAHPDALVLVHPETRPEVVALADHVDSTAGILRYVRESNHKKFIIGTEMGILHRLKKENPDKEFYILTPKLICANMKKTHLSHVLEALETLSPEIHVPEEIRIKAKRALERMLAIKGK
ncbi:quinolinate synthase [Anoxybacter fermentans]|uniref:Quinolinate synthase n=1 Tax=Anoxybacter fermentans TaxID=1323375 RepID=A0A3Q9HSA9_9FIRM|nr:quinolinate synthase NadA [Anoxybacter fermentans]AZR74658.1 quinolinate synthase [Anoxybacter fermentans]